VMRLTMPPLRERREDIPMLTRHFLQKCANRTKVKPKPVSREAMAALVHYEWPGNVRELENAIERALVMGSSDTVLLEDLPESLLEQETPAEMNEGKYQAGVKGFKKQMIVDALEQTRGNYVEAAGILGMHPNNLHRLIRNLGMKEALQEKLRERNKFSA
jgi:DNA-binding NtrC family response regulator